ncbi:hypothetical protein POVWA2_069010 [Plasmodium ovale wallikeri]|uniref:STP1 protein n=1 Tax=Plasmodium ovale wallikeri TaxID=864142 RepID=A0A1A9AHJ6_PLAOA|nr:hypothetical protein POVWA2_069010 [Plasmodium ovale wallikeri]
MAAHQGYATNTHHIPVDFFIGMIEGRIKKLIHTYGHKNCGLRHEELCKEIKKIISDNKQILFQYMDPSSKIKWTKEWDSRRRTYFNKLFDEEGFINMCFPFKNIEHQDLYQLQSRHVNFCIEKDKRRLALGKSPEYNACKEYNEWIETQKASFTPEFLQKVSHYFHKTVKKYFITKKHPGGHDPLPTYLHSKLNCNRYNPSKKSHPQKQIVIASPDIPHLPTSPDVGQESQGKDGRSAPGIDGGNEKKKSDVMIPPQTEPPSSDSLKSSITITKEDGTANDQHDDLEAKGTGLPNNAQDAKGQPNEATDTKAQSPEQLPETTSSISPKNSLVAKDQDPSPSVIEGQGTDSDATPSTTSATSGTKHSTENIPSPLAPDLSFAQPQPPSVAAVADQYPQEPTPPDLIIKSTNHGASLTSSDPGLVPSHVADSDSSEISSTSTTISATSSTTTISTPGSSLAQDPHIPTPSTQPVVTTSIITTITQSTTSASSSPAITVSVMGTNPISSTVGITSTMDSGKSNAPFKNIPGSRDPNILPPKNKDDSLSHNKGKTSKTNTIYNQKQNDEMMR